MNNLEQSILQLVNAPGYRPIKPRVIAQRLNLSKDQAVDVRRAVKQLVRQGKLRYSSNHLVMPVAPGTDAKTHAKNSRELTAPGKSCQKTPGGVASRLFSPRRQPRAGRLPTDAKGLWFRPSRPGRRAGQRSRKTSTFPPTARPTPPPATWCWSKSAGPAGGELGPRGAIVEVVERQTHQFVGTYLGVGRRGLRADRRHAVRPADLRGRSRGEERPAGRQSGHRDAPFPLAASRRRGRDHRSARPAGHAGRRYALDHPRVQPARPLSRPTRPTKPTGQADKFDESIGSRTDFTGETIVTIDPADARDFDDAISLERLDNGHWRLGVHIADVSHFVRPKTALDREALERARASICPTACCRCCPR